MDAAILEIKTFTNTGSEQRSDYVRCLYRPIFRIVFTRGGKEDEGVFDKFHEVVWETNYRY